jgi:hypothetical protein
MAMVKAQSASGGSHFKHPDNTDERAINFFALAKATYSLRISFWAAACIMNTDISE